MRRRGAAAELYVAVGREAQHSPLQLATLSALLGL
jgi:hypothetical protein